MHNIRKIQKSEDPLYYKSRMERVKEYLLSNLAADLSIGTVAKKFGLNQTTLRHVFKKEQHESYRDYVEGLRMAKARKLLENGKWVKEVTRETGYRNRATFNNAFKKRFKYPPSYFKK